jgi:acyl carrier protein
VEAALLEVPGVREAVVLAHGSGPEERRLVAYVVPKAGANLGPQGLRRALGQALSPHMVPHSFAVLERLPRTASGKVDRGALPPAPQRRPDLDTPHAAPRGPVEMRLADIWALALDLDTVGIHDPFLDLGGDSLAAMRIAARVTETWQASVAMTELLSAVTVAEMAALLEAPPGADACQATGR